MRHLIRRKQVRTMTLQDDVYGVAFGVGPPDPE